MNHWPISAIYLCQRRLCARGATLRLWAAVFMGIIAWSRCAAGSPLPNRNELIDIISKAEEKLLNIKIESSYTGEIAQPHGDHWDDDGSGKLTAWFAGAPGSKLRVNYEEQRVPWLDGPVPFSIEKFDDGFDGRERRVLWYREGSPRSPSFRLRGRLEATRQINFNAFATGWEASLYGALDGDHPRRFSAALAEIATSTNEQESI